MLLNKVFPLRWLPGNCGIIISKICEESDCHIAVAHHKDDSVGDHVAQFDFGGTGITVYWASDRKWKRSVSFTLRFTSGGGWNIWHRMNQTLCYRQHEFGG